MYEDFIKRSAWGCVIRKFFGLGGRHAGTFGKKRFFEKEFFSPRGRTP